MPIEVERDGNKIVLVLGRTERWAGMRIYLNVNDARVLIAALRKAINA